MQFVRGRDLPTSADSELHRNRLTARMRDDDCRAADPVAQLDPLFVSAWLLPRAAEATLWHNVVVSIAMVTVAMCINDRTSRQSGTLRSTRMALPWMPDARSETRKVNTFATSAKLTQRAGSASGIAARFA